LAAAAAALDPFELVPTALEYANTHDGYRLRVSFEVDPGHTDINRVLARLLPRRGCAVRRTRFSPPRRAS
jgi:hypothetical protein